MVSLCFVHPNSTLVFCAIYPAFPPKVVTVTEVTVFSGGGYKGFGVLSDCK